MSEELKCQICGAPATVHLTQIINGKMRKIHLCEKCAAKHNATELPLIKFAEMITKKLFGEKLGKEILEGTAKAFSEKDLKLGKLCPKCGMSESELEKHERFGCPQCYETFAESLNALLPKIQHANAAPEGSAPAPVASAKKRKAAPEVSVEALEQALREAVSKEDYKLAATLRDQIAALKNKPAKPARKKAAAQTATGKKAPTATNTAKRSRGGKK